MKTSRTASRSIAALVEELELRQPVLVTGDLLLDIVTVVNSPLVVAEAAQRLVRAGWLLPLRTRNSWEFAPASRAGRYGSDDALIELRAVLGRHPDAPVAVGFESAVWMYGYSEHRPNRPVFVHRRGWRPPKSLSEMRAVTFDWKLASGTVNGVPVLVPPSALVACAERPEQMGDWANADEWLGETMRASSLFDLINEAEGRNTATLGRLGYLAEWAHRFDIADEIERISPDRPSVTYLGPRGAPGARWVPRWRLYDSALPRGLEASVSS